MRISLRVDRICGVATHGLLNQVNLRYTCNYMILTNESNFEQVQDKIAKFLQIFVTTNDNLQYSICKIYRQIIYCDNMNVSFCGENKRFPRKSIV